MPVGKVRWMAGGYVDCHCHITAEEFLEDTDDIIIKSRKDGIQALVCVTEHAAEFERLVHLSERFPDFVMPCLGIHPIQTTAAGQRSVMVKDVEAVLPEFDKYKDSLVAIGEIGLDFTPWLAPSSEQREQQLKAFQMQLDIAKRLDLPINVHSRSAGRQTIAFLKEQGAQKVLLHNFAGRPSVALEGVQAGYFFSFPPAIVRNDQRAKLIKQIPLENLCLETDSPSLGPTKQERNIPSNIGISCRYIASVKGLPPELVCEATASNALRLFPRVAHKLNS
ncbi:putative deoxyribonuclease tatdn3-A isoform X2 [Spea bombifrons]|uniref:putative deoxyribonuclease tatdn3-A isoform X2 n=1 Tax=Spea bombifrons TaxID=233779 RepID=UPI00234B0193|nr:putative deoxyribonuclease tatdn3-A isoform X2 [Spea bombifrons]